MQYFLEEEWTIDSIGIILHLQKYSDSYFLAVMKYIKRDYLRKYHCLTEISFGTNEIYSIVNIVPSICIRRTYFLSNLSNNNGET